MEDLFSLDIPLFKQKPANKQTQTHLKTYHHHYHPSAMPPKVSQNLRLANQHRVKMTEKEASLTACPTRGQHQGMEKEKIGKIEKEERPESRREANRGSIPIGEAGNPSRATTKEKEEPR